VSFRGDSCADTGVVVLTIPATDTSRNLAYTFEQIAGKAPTQEAIFPPGPSTGHERNGLLVFAFPWLDGATNTHTPLDLTVRVAAFTKSGKRGGFTDVHITDSGR